MNLEDPRTQPREIIVCDECGEEIGYRAQCGCETDINERNCDD